MLRIQEVAGLDFLSFTGIYGYGAISAWIAMLLAVLVDSYVDEVLYKILLLVIIISSLMISEVLAYIMIRQCCHSPKPVPTFLSYETSGTTQVYGVAAR